MPPIINKNKCTFCTLCSQICPMDILKADQEKREIKVCYPEECWHCRACVVDCPGKAIELRYPLSHFILHKEVEKEGDRGE